MQTNPFDQFLRRIVSCAAHVCLYTLRCSLPILLELGQKFLVCIGVFFRKSIPVIFGIILSANSFAAVSLQIKNDEIPKTKILIYGFKSEDSRIKNTVTEILDQIKENLESTALFDIVTDLNDPNLIIVNPDQSTNTVQNEISIEKVPEFNKYKSAKIDTILIANIIFNDLENKLELKIRFWDILDEKQLFGKYYSTTIDRNKNMANLISDKIFEAVTGEKSGHFNTQIVYVAESGSPVKRKKRITLMDFDGENRRYLTSGSDLVLTPIFSKKPNELLFLRYYKNYNPQIYNMDLENKFMSRINVVNKTTFAPAVHPTNPNLLLFSIIENGDSNIYEINRYNDRLTKLTESRSINTTPSYSPDGKRIVFSSDRSGTEKIYVMNYDGSELKMISKGNGSYSKPVWSPDGRFIAFTNIASNRFNIGIMTPEGKNERVLTSAYLAEGARWSPNGRYLIYSKKTSAYGPGSVPKIYVLDILTEYERQLPTAKNEGATDPDWAPVW